MDWRGRAICRDSDPDLFFPIGNVSSGPPLMQVEEAKSMCQRCPALGPCRDWAVEADPVEGIWGGTTEAERRAIRRRAARQGQAAAERIT